MPVFEADFDETMRKYDASAQSAEDETIDRGLYVASRPEDGDRPELPANLGELGPAELKHLLGQLTAWYSYALGQKGVADIKRRAAEKKRDFAWKRIRKMKNGTVSDKDDEAGTDVRYINIDVEAERCDYLCMLLGIVAEGLKREVETVSRLFAMVEQRFTLEGRAISAERGKPREDVLSVFRTGKRRP